MMIMCRAGCRGQDKAVEVAKGLEKVNMVARSGQAVGQVMGSEPGSEPEVIGSTKGAGQEVTGSGELEGVSLLTF